MNETANAHVYGYAVIGYTQEIVNSFKINQKKFKFPFKIGTTREHLEEKK